MINEEQAKQELYDAVPDLYKIKKNPNNWIIIKKYNNRIFQKNKFKMFNLIETIIESEMQKSISINAEKMRKIKDD